MISFCLFHYVFYFTYSIYITIITLYGSYFTVHRLEMRSRRVELESNPSYITVQPSRTCTDDYENITF